MRNYSSPRIIQLSILPPVGQPCPPQEDTAGLCMSDSTRATGRRNRKGGAPQGFLCRLCAPPSASRALILSPHSNQRTSTPISPARSLNRDETR
jgi:hypothetical protein